MELESIKTGAAFNRRTAKKSPLEILHSIISTDPNQSTERLFSKWRKLVEADPDQLDAVLHYAFINFHSQIQYSQRQPPKPRPQPTRNKRTEITQLAKQIKQTIYLEMIMPNGKRLKNCSFKEVSTFGDMFKLIAAQGKPSEIVGDVITESDIKRLFA